MGTLWELNTVFVLGAGFSRACFKEMPLTDELGSRVAANLGLEIGERERQALSRGVRAMGFESYLSMLAERHPHQTDAEWHLAQATLAAALPQISEEISRVQRGIGPARGPWWLSTMLELVGLARASMVTFNYDTLVELHWPRHWPPLAQGLGTNPSQMPVRRTEGRHEYAQLDPDSCTSGLYKLHGSINWFADPGDEHGATLQVATDTEGLRGLPRRHHFRAHDGHEPVIVPPTSTKSAALRRAFIAGLWKGARARLEGAQRVVLVGYSMPTTDRATASLFGEIAQRQRRDWVVVDIDPQPVIDRLLGIGVELESIQSFGGVNAIREFVCAELARVAKVALLDEYRVAQFKRGEIYPIISGPTVGDTVVRRRSTTGSFNLEIPQRADARGTYASIAQGIEQPFDWIIEDPSDARNYLPVFGVEATLTADQREPSRMEIFVGSPVPLRYRPLPRESA